MGRKLTCSGDMYICMHSVTPKWDIYDRIINYWLSKNVSRHKITLKILHTISVSWSVNCMPNWKCLFIYFFIYWCVLWFMAICRIKRSCRSTDCMDIWFGLSFLFTIPVFFCWRPTKEAIWALLSDNVAVFAAWRWRKHGAGNEIWFWI